MARELHTMVEISASPDQVWQVLTDFDVWGVRLLVETLAR